ncbi:unnamed protein product [Phaedon cochleariae]|uniref:Ammonium transporter AmtB-like domain-containing protein n=1 Tax=Phaedon cochleariae TaxID=80249 RepID=A0A9N9SHC7_PHACE|nr:unnamed protein product [Phaedon cochleariae]
MGMKESVLPLVVSQGLLVILFCVFTTYKDNSDLSKYGMFQDVHVMIFIGFGFLMTFLKRYGYSSLGFTLLLGSFIIQWAMLCQGFFDITEDYKIELGLESLYRADIAAASVLISMGAILGRTTITQLLLMGAIEIALYCTNSYLGSKILKVTDAGGSIFVHVFGAYFGLAVSYVINRRKNGKKESGNSLLESTYTSDLFAMIGTAFLWLYWPSFNAVELAGAQQRRAVLNTYLALAACCVTTFACSQLADRDRKLDMAHCQNATLAGGVAMGAAANLAVGPGGAVGPLIESHLKTPDTCGVHNLHGLPGVLAAIVSALMAGLASEDTYGLDFYQIFPARKPEVGSVLEPRTAIGQAGYQLLALVVTLVIAIVGGLITGE